MGAITYIATQWSATLSVKSDLVGHNIFRFVLLYINCLFFTINLQLLIPYWKRAICLSISFSSIGIITVLLKLIVEMKKVASFYRPDYGLKLTPFWNASMRIRGFPGFVLFLLMTEL